MTDIPAIQSREKDERRLAFESLLAWADRARGWKARGQDGIVLQGQHHLMSIALKLTIEGSGATPSTPNVICSSTLLGNSSSIASGSAN
jgi:hypothetical protein